MTRGVRGREPSRSGGQWRTVTKHDDGHFHKTAGQRREMPANSERPQQDSNLRSRLRRPLLSPLSYGGYATQKRVPVKKPVQARDDAGTGTGRETLPSCG